MFNCCKFATIDIFAKVTALLDKCVISNGHRKNLQPIAAQGIEGLEKFATLLQQRHEKRPDFAANYSKSGHPIFRNTSREIVRVLRTDKTDIKSRNPLQCNDYKGFRLVETTGLEPVTSCV